MSADQAAGLGMCALKADEDGEHWGQVHDVRGLFAARTEEDLLTVELLGCHPQGGLHACLDSMSAGGVQLGGAWLDVLDSDGVSMGSYFVYEMTATAARPSSLDSRLVDLSVTLYCDNAQYGGEWVWNLIRDGRLDRRDIWHGLDTEDRTAWLAVALWTSAYQRRGRPDSAPGHVFTLDGRAVTDIDSFYCALGETINGPGGYFGLEPRCSVGLPARRMGRFQPVHAGMAALRCGAGASADTPGRGCRANLVRFAFEDPR